MGVALYPRSIFESVFADSAAAIINPENLAIANTKQRLTMTPFLPVTIRAVNVMGRTMQKPQAAN